MAVGMKKKWKLPISFHFTAGLGAETLSVLVKQAIDSLHQLSIHVIALVMDGLRKKCGMNVIVRLPYYRCRVQLGT